MPGKVGIGMQDFRKIRERNAFYIDKTLFIKEWWESLDDVTLITRPRRFGKTLTMSMVENFYLMRLLLLQFINCRSTSAGIMGRRY